MARKLAICLTLRTLLCWSALLIFQPGPAFAQSSAAAAMPIPLPGEAANARQSAFYFNHELQGNDQPAPAKVLHASAIHHSNGRDSRVWINGVELGLNDRIDRARILAIEPLSAVIEIAKPGGGSTILELGLNQSLNIESMSLSEGLTIPSQAGASLARTRLP